jgi:hypothetical protein
MTPPGDWLMRIADALRAALGAYLHRLARPPQPVWIGERCFMARPEPERLPRLADPLWVLFLARLARAVHRFDALHRAWRAGSLPPLRPRRIRNRASQATPATPPPRLPRAHGWINHRVRDSHQVAGQLNAMLQAEATRDFLQAVPRAGRHLRPLCVALGLRQPAWLRLPPRPRKPRAPRPARPRPPSLTDPSLDLRPCVVDAARVWKRRDRQKTSG